jgi:hypothetical protein
MVFLNRPCLIVWCHFSLRKLECTAALVDLRLRDRDGGLQLGGCLTLVPAVKTSTSESKADDTLAV